MKTITRKHAASAFKTLLLMAAMTMAGKADAQFYSGIMGSSGRGRIMINAGAVNTFGTPSIIIGNGLGVSYSDKIKPQSVDFDIQPAFMLALESEGNLNDDMHQGIGFNFLYSKNQWMADFSGDDLGDANYNYRFGKKTHSLLIEMGYNLSYYFTDRFEVRGGIGIGADLQFGCYHRGEAIRKSNGQLYNDPSINEWHKMDIETGLDIDFSGFLSVGADYYITESIFLGVTAHFKHAFAGTSFPKDTDLYSGPSVGYNVFILDGKFNRLSAFLTLGFNI